MQQKIDQYVLFVVWLWSFWTVKNDVWRCAGHVDSWGRTKKKLTLRCSSTSEKLESKTTCRDVHTYTGEETFT